MSEQRQPEAVWVFPPKKNRGPRIALVVLLVVLALIVAAGLVVFLIPHDNSAPNPTPTSPTPSPSPSPSPSTSASPPPSPIETTAPTPGDPSVAVFRDQIGFRLSTAGVGLELIAQGGDDTGSTVSKLQGDAQRLADTAPPASIDADWRADVQIYSDSLDQLAANPADTNALNNARSALGAMEALVGGS